MNPARDSLEPMPTALAKYAASATDAHMAQLYRQGAVFNLYFDLKRAFERPGPPLRVKELRKALSRVIELDREMRTLFARANKAAARCGKPEVRPV